MRIIYILTFLLLYTSLTAQNENFEWGKSFRSRGDATSRKTMTDDSGNIYLTGSFTDSISFGEFKLSSSGDQDVYLAKLNPDGIAIWAKNFGGNGADEGTALVKDQNNNIYLGGSFENIITIGNSTLTSSGSRDVFITKLSDNGTVVWSKKGGGLYYDSLHDISLDSDSNIIITGNFLEHMTIGNVNLTSAGSYDFFVSKINPEGNVMWAKSYGGQGEDLAKSLILDEQNNIYLTGYIGGQTTFGNDTYTVKGISDIFILKINPSGNVIWSKQIGGTAYDEGTKIIIDKNNQIFIAGYFAISATFGNQLLISAGLQDVFISKLDTDGNFIWTVKGGGTSMDIPYNISLTPNGTQIFVSGAFTNTATFGNTTVNSFGDSYNTFALKLNSANGAFLWADRIGGFKIGTGSMALFNDNLYVSGNFEGLVKFGNTITANGTARKNIYLSKVKASYLNVGGNRNDIKIFPNPTKDLVNIDYKGEVKNISVKDQTGRLVLSSTKMKNIDLKN